VSETKVRSQLAECGGRVMVCEVGGQVSVRCTRAPLAVLRDRNFKVARDSPACTRSFKFTLPPCADASRKREGRSRVMMMSRRAELSRALRRKSLPQKRKCHSGLPPFSFEHDDSGVASDRTAFFELFWPPALRRGNPLLERRCF